MPGAITATRRWRLAVWFVRLLWVFWSFVAPATWGFVSVASSRFAITDLQLVLGSTDQHVLQLCEAKQTDEQERAEQSQEAAEAEDADADGAEQDAFPSRSKNAVWIIAGVSWTGVSSPSARLCVRREPIEQLVEQDDEDDPPQVLTRIVVLEDMMLCPKSMQLLQRMQHQSHTAVVCLLFGDAKDALTKRNYISDIMVTKDKNYNNQFSGWTTLPINVLLPSNQPSYTSDRQGAQEMQMSAAASGLTAHFQRHVMATTNQSVANGTDACEVLDQQRRDQSLSHTGAFISFQRQVLPIVDFKMIEDVGIRQSFLICESLTSNKATAFWEQAGEGYLDMKQGFLRKVLCLQRDVGAAAGHSKQAILTQVRVPTACVSVNDSESSSNEPDPSTVCGPGFTRVVQIKASLDSVFSLCGKFRSSTETQAFVGDLAIVRTSSSRPFDLRLMPGSWRGVNVDLNDGVGCASGYLFYRNAVEFMVAPPAPLSKPPLVARQVGSSLKFKVLQLADLHFTGAPNFPCREAPRHIGRFACKEAMMSEFIERLLDLEKPDFVAYTGDNVETLFPRMRQLAMDAAFKAVEARGIPWAMVLGNHDDENGFEREDIFRMAASKKHSYIQHGPKEVAGVGNYEVTVFAPAKSGANSQEVVVLRMYFLDSHSYPDRSVHPDASSEYDWVKQSQIDFYRVLSDSHRQRHQRVPALMFFHIPIPEYDMASTAKLSGEKNEGVCSPTVNSNLFSTLVELDEVKAVFVGHDHLNDYCVPRQGIQLCYGGGTGLGRAYGSESFGRRARVIEWTQQPDGTRSITSWKRHLDAIDKIQHMETLYQE